MSFFFNRSKYIWNSFFNTRLGTDIHKAAWEGNLDVVQAFVTTRSSLVNEDDDTDHGDKYRPLHYAAYQGHEDVCKYLKRLHTGTLRSWQNSMKQTTQITYRKTFVFVEM